MAQVARIDEYSCQPTDFERLAREYGEILAVSVAVSQLVLSIHSSWDSDLAADILLIVNAF